MDFDTILKEIGEFGRFQQTNYLLICLPVLFSAANSLSYVFTAGIPNYRCTVPECDNANNPIYDQSWASYAVPGTTDSNGLFIPEQCIRFKRVNSSNFVNDVCTEDSFSHETEICNQWVYDNTERTIVQEWTITCPENKWKLALVGTMHFAGILAGTAVFGFLADRFGRKIMFICAIFIMAITGMGQGWANDYITFLIFAFLNAVGTSGVYPLAFILGVEMVGPGKRELTGIVLNYFYAIGEAAVGLAAWLSRDWVILQFIVSAPPIIFIFYYWLIPESVRWLLARKEHRKAELIILKAAKTNGVIISESILQTLDIQHSDIVDEANSANKVVVTGKPTVLHALKNLVLSKVLVIRCLILAYIWAANAFVYYGLSLNSTNLSGNKYLNFALVCLVEIPGYSLAWLAMNKIGRRKSLAGSLLLCAFTCALGGYIDQQLTWAVVVLFLIGKLGITASFGLIYVYSAELLPTVIRSCGMGMLSTVARFGALVAPFVPLLDVYYKSLPLLLFAAVSAIGGIIAIPLPETLGYPLPDTVEEAESIGRKVQDKK